MTTRKQTTSTKPAVEEKEFIVSDQKFVDSTKIKFKENPKRKNSAAWGRYEKYQTATTWGKYRELNDGKFMMADARHDLGKGFLTTE